MSKQILEIITEYPQEQHIPEDVHDVAMHEHRTQEIKVNRQRGSVMSDLARVAKCIPYYLYARKVDAFRHLLRNKRESVAECIVSAQALKKHKNENVDAD